MSSGGGYSGGMGGYGGGFGQPPMFGGGFGGGFGQPPQFGGGFGGGFGQPPQYGGGFGSPYGGFGGGFGQPQQFGGGFGQPQQSPFGGGSQGPTFQTQGSSTLGNAYAQRFQNPSVGMFPPTSPQPNQPPPGMELNPNYRPSNRMTQDMLPSDLEYRPIQQPQPQTGGGREYTPPPQFSSGPIAPSFDSGYGNQFGGDTQDIPRPVRPAGSFLGGSYDPAGGYLGGFGGGYSSPYMSSAIMSGLGSLFGGMQGGGFQGMFNPQSQAQAQMRAYQQNQQRNPNQPPPGMKLNPTYDAGYAMAEDMPPPGSAAAISKQRFIPSSPTEIQPQFGVVNRQDEGENSFKKLMATLPSEERAKYHGTSEHRNSANTLETIRRTRQDPEWGRYYQNKSDDEIYAGMKLGPS